MIDHIARRYGVSPAELMDIDMAVLLAIAQMGSVYDAVGRLKSAKGAEIHNLSPSDQSVIAGLRRLGVNVSL